MLYRILLFVHVVAVVAWVGSGFLFQIFTERAVKTRDPVTMKMIVDEGERLGKVLFGPAAIVVLASGIWLVLEGEWGFDDPFVIGGLLGVATSILLGVVGIGPTTRRLETSLSSPASEPESDILLKLRDVGRLDLAIMTIVIFLMTAKPGT